MKHPIRSICLKGKALLIFFFVINFSLSCASSKMVQITPPFQIVKTTLAKNIDSSGEDQSPVDSTDLFSISDQKVVSHVQLKNVSDKHTIKWEWFMPDGSLYASSKNCELSPSKGRYFKDASAFHTMVIQGDKAAFFPGTWMVKVLYDGDVISTKNFQIKEVDAPPKANSPITIIDKRNAYAVIIGISRYQYSGPDGFKNLAFADDDAEAFRDMLLNLGWSNSRIMTLINENAKRNDVLIALESWLTKAGPNDMIVLFWSGHGYPDPEDPEKVYFACYDTQLNIPATGYRMDSVRQSLQERNAKNVIVLADTCHAGKLITRGRGISVQPYMQKLKREQMIPKGWIYMVGAETDRQAIEHSSWSNGAFTHTLLKALKGEADGFESVAPKDGIVTMIELRSFLESVMPDETQRVLGTAKRPIITTSSGDPNIWKITLDLKD